MLKSLYELLLNLQNVFLLLLGALIGIGGTIIIWYKQNREERRQKRADLLLRTIDLTCGTGTHTRCLIYSKNEGIKGVHHLPENPVDKIMAIVHLHFPEAREHVQMLHKHQQDLFAINAGEPDAHHSIQVIGEKMEQKMNDLLSCLHRIAVEEKLDE